MKYLFTLSLIFFSLSISAQDSKVKLMKIVLTDSVINEYITNLGRGNSNVFKLFHGSGYYIFSEGNVIFEGYNCDNNSSKYEQSGIIKKVKIKKKKAIVKLHFPSGNNTRVRLKKELNNRRIKSRLVYRSWRFPKEQPRIVYYSLDMDI